MINELIELCRLHCIGRTRGNISFHTFATVTFLCHWCDENLRLPTMRHKIWRNRRWLSKSLYKWWRVVYLVDVNCAKYHVGYTNAWNYSMKLSRYKYIYIKIYTSNTLLLHFNLRNGHLLSYRRSVVHSNASKTTLVVSAASRHVILRNVQKTEKWETHKRLTSCKQEYWEYVWVSTDYRKRL